MTYQYDTNNPITSNTGAAWLYGLKVLLLSVGWTCPRSGDGTSGGAGDFIATVTDLTDVNSWMVLRRPDDGAEWMFSKGGIADTGTWDILYSAAAMFTGGTSGARATAVDEQILASIATQTFIGGNSTWSAVADDSAPYGWILYGWDTAAGTNMGGMVVYDPMSVGSYYADDPDPYICATVQQYGTYRIDDNNDAANSDVPKGWSGATWGAIPGSELADGAGSRAFPKGCGVNPYSGSSQDPILGVPYTRNSLQAGVSAWKGFGTVVKWVGTNRASKDTLTASDGIRIIWGNTDLICIPWAPAPP